MSGRDFIVIGGIAFFTIYNPDPTWRELAVWVLMYCIMREPNENNIKNTL